MNKKVKRLMAANLFLEVIATRGREFFAFNHPEGREVARFTLDASHLYFWEEWHREWIYVSRRRPLKRFHHGGTLHALVHDLVDYIKTGKQIDATGFEHWAYGAAIKEVIAGGQSLGVIQQDEIEES